MTDYRFLQIRVTPELQNKVKDAAWTAHMSVTQLVNSILWAYVQAIAENPAAASDPAAAARDGAAGESSEKSDLSGGI